MYDLYFNVSLWPKLPVTKVRWSFNNERKLDKTQQQFSMTIMRSFPRYDQTIVNMPVERNNVIQKTRNRN